MFVTCIDWDHMGSVLAIGGTQHQSGSEKAVNVVQFYAPYGEVLPLNNINDTKVR